MSPGVLEERETGGTIRGDFEVPPIDSNRSGPFQWRSLQPLEVAGLLSFFNNSNYKIP